MRDPNEIVALSEWQTISAAFGNKDTIRNPLRGKIEERQRQTGNGHKNPEKGLGERSGGFLARACSKTADRSIVREDEPFAHAPNETAPGILGWGLVQSLVHLKVAPLAIALFSKYTQQESNL